MSALADAIFRNLFIYDEPGGTSFHHASREPVHCEGEAPIPLDPRPSDSPKWADAVTAPPSRESGNQLFAKSGQLKAVDGVSYSIASGETLGIVGESAPPGRVTGGRVIFDGTDLLGLDEEPMRRVRGKRIAMIFQEPMTALNPVLKIGAQIAEQILAHEGVSKRDATDRAVDLLKQVGIPAPEKRVEAYPHQLSGGMRQRAMIAMALSCGPDLLIADEPTTALDVTIQAQILELLRDLQRKNGMAMQFITHDLGVISEVADRVAVIYAGKIVEEAGVDEIFAKPLHPYTRGLLKSIPKLDTNEDKLRAIEGSVPSLDAMPSGCRFAGRCPNVLPRCRAEEPPLARWA
jgi:peptide/nickel transport system ATP-binding protein